MEKNAYNKHNFHMDLVEFKTLKLLLTASVGLGTVWMEKNACNKHKLHTDLVEFSYSTCDPNPFSAPPAIGVNQAELQSAKKVGYLVKKFNGQNVQYYPFWCKVFKRVGHCF